MALGRNFRTYINTVATCISPALFRCSITKVWGSTRAFFTLGSVGVPVIGALQGVSTVVGIELMQIIWGTLRLSISASSMPSPFTLVQAYHIPTFCSALYLATLLPDGTQQRSVRALVAGGCILSMSLFWIHPVGRGAGGYALYWCIPLFLSFWSHRSRFLHVLSATFLAHAVGSVAWLWQYGMTVPFWVGLIPVVARERMLLSGMTWCCWEVGLALRAYFTGVTAPHRAVSRNTIHTDLSR